MNGYDDHQDSVDFENLEDSSLAPRRPWLAVVMSLCAFGLGQFYNGQWHRGLWVALILLFLMGPAVAIAALALPPAAVAPMIAIVTGLFILVWLVSHVMAYRTARRLTMHRLFGWQKIGVYVVLFLVINALLIPISAHYIRSHWVQPFRIPSGSMQPTLLPGDYVLADMRYNCALCSQAVKPGDMVVFRYPNNPSLTYLKRVVGMPGDTVSFENYEVLLNGEPVPWIAEQPNGDDPAGMDTSEFLSNPIVVPSGEVFVLGDNRTSSRDSRVFGTVKITEILGRIRQIYFSRGEEGLRWSRVGRVPE